MINPPIVPLSATIFPVKSTFLALIVPSFEIEQFVAESTNLSPEMLTSSLSTLNCALTLPFDTFNDICSAVCVILEDNSSSFDVARFTSAVIDSVVCKILLLRFPSASVALFASSSIFSAVCVIFVSSPLSTSLISDLVSSTLRSNSLVFPRS